MAMDWWKAALLALAAAAIGFFFNRLLEKYKTRVAYRSKLTDRRIDAYEKAGVILQKTLLRTHHLVQIIERGFGKDPEAEQQEMDAAYESLSDTYHDEMPIATAYANLYLPYNTYKSFSDFQTSLSEFTVVLQGPPSGEEGRKQLRNVADRMIDHLSALQVALRNEIEKPPV